MTLKDDIDCLEFEIVTLKDVIEDYYKEIECLKLKLGGSEKSINDMVQLISEKDTALICFKDKYETRITDLKIIIKDLKGQIADIIKSNEDNDV